MHKQKTLKKENVTGDENDQSMASIASKLSSKSSLQMLLQEHEDKVQSEAEKARIQQMNEKLVESAKKNLVDKTKIGQAIRSKKGEHELEKQKEVALKIIKDAAKYEPT